MRYDRQEVLKHIGREGQEKLSNSSVTIVGAGSTGTVAAELLARAGIGRLTIIDHDIVEESNLNRQVLYAEADVEKPKAEAAAKRLREINSQVEVKAEKMHLSQDNVETLQSDVVLDCTDNMQTRLLINDYCKREDIPWIYAAAVEARGMVYVTKGSPCFKCVFQKAKSLEQCETHGILNTASTQVASVQATEALKLLLGGKHCQDLIHLNVWENRYRKLGVQEDPQCRACNGEYEHLEPAEQDYRIEWCDSKAAMSAKPETDMDLDMESLEENFDLKADADIVAVIEADGEEVVVHDYGELLFKEEENEDRLKELAEKIYSAARR